MNNNDTAIDIIKNKCNEDEYLNYCLDILNVELLRHSKIKTVVQVNLNYIVIYGYNGEQYNLKKIHGIWFIETPDNKKYAKNRTIIHINGISDSDAIGDTPAYKLMNKLNPLRDIIMDKLKYKEYNQSLDFCLYKLQNDKTKHPIQYSELNFDCILHDFDRYTNKIVIEVYYERHTELNYEYILEYAENKWFIRDTKTELTDDVINRYMKEESILAEEESVKESMEENLRDHCKCNIKPKFKDIIRIKEDEKDEYVGFDDPDTNLPFDESYSIYEVSIQCPHCLAVSKDEYYIHNDYAIKDVLGNMRKYKQALTSPLDTPEVKKEIIKGKILYQSN